MKDLEIIYLSPGDLIPYSKNAKKHPPEQVEHIANSLREFGFRQPLVVDAGNTVIIGHGRLLAAQKLGLEKVPVVKADDLTEAQIKALRLADNKTNESEWDLDFLDGELLELQGDINMEDFGFDLENQDIDRQIDAVVNDNPTLTLPKSRVYIFAVSAFGTESEVFLQTILEQEEAEKLIKKHKEGKTTELMETIRGAINADT